MRERENDPVGIVQDVPWSRAMLSAADTMQSSCPSHSSHSQRPLPWDLLPPSGSPLCPQVTRAATDAWPRSLSSCSILQPVQLGVLVLFSTLLVPSALGPLQVLSEHGVALPLCAIDTRRRADSRGMSSLQRWTVLGFQTWTGGIPSHQMSFPRCRLVGPTAPDLVDFVSCCPLVGVGLGGVVFSRPSMVP